MTINKNIFGNQGFHKVKNNNNTFFGTNIIQKQVEFIQKLYDQSNYYMACVMREITVAHLKTIKTTITNIT